jgi:hypothetical protein
LTEFDQNHRSGCIVISVISSPKAKFNRIVALYVDITKDIFCLVNNNIQTLKILKKNIHILKLYTFFQFKRFFLLKYEHYYADK